MVAVTRTDTHKKCDSNGNRTSGTTMCIRAYEQRLRKPLAGAAGKNTFPSRAAPQQFLRSCVMLLGIARQIHFFDRIPGQFPVPDIEEA
jgi:hypothetical protein